MTVAVGKPDCHGPKSDVEIIPDRRIVGEVPQADMTRDRFAEEAERPRTGSEEPSVFAQREGASVDRPG